MGPSLFKYWFTQCLTHQDPINSNSSHCMAVIRIQFSWMKWCPAQYNSSSTELFCLQQINNHHLSTSQLKSLGSPLGILALPHLKKGSSTTNFPILRSSGLRKNLFIKNKYTFFHYQIILHPSDIWQEKLVFWEVMRQRAGVVVTSGRMWGILTNASDICLCNKWCQMWKIKS